MDGFTRRFVTTEAETDVGHPARNAGVGQVLLDPARRFNKVYRVVVMLLDTRRHRKNIRVEDDVFWWESGANQ